MRVTIVLYVAWFLFVSMLILMFYNNAFAHPTMDLTPYYTSECCSQKDCRIINADDHESPLRIKVTREGYEIIDGDFRRWDTDAREFRHENFIRHGDKRIRISPDSHWHLCSTAGMDHDATLYCLFIPNAGA